MSSALSSIGNDSVETRRSKARTVYAVRIAEHLRRLHGHGERAESFLGAATLVISGLVTLITGLDTLIAVVSPPSEDDMDQTPEESADKN